MIKRLTILFFFICSVLLAFAQQTDSIQFQSDQVDIEWRIPSEDKIEKYRADENFDYTKTIDPRSLFQKFMDWLNGMFPDDKDQIGSVLHIIFTILKYLGIALIISVLVYFIMKLCGVKFKNIFGKKKSDSQIEDINVESEDINEMSFQRLISEAVSNGNYRLAIRYTYLQSLKQLSDKGIIKWNPTKTNMSYLSEIKTQDLRNEFFKITFIFDYVWYGENDLDSQGFEIAQNQFNNFNKMAENEQ